MSEKLPYSGPSSALDHAVAPAGAAAVVRPRSRHQRHIATTHRLHSLRSSSRDETTLLAKAASILCDSFGARGACIARRNAESSPSVRAEALERCACARRDDLVACGGSAAGAFCRALVHAPRGVVGEARLDLGDDVEDSNTASVRTRFLLDVQLADGEVLVIAIDHPVDGLGRDLTSDDVRDDLAHFEELGRVLVDVLDAERTLTRLKLREAELSSMLGAIPDILTIVDADGTIVGFHNGDERHLLDPNDYIGRQVADLLPPEVWRAAEPVWQRAITTRRMQEHRYTLEGGGRMLHFVSRGQAYGEPPRVLWHTRDVTEERRLQEKLLSIQRFEGVALLASALAHDFSNLLTGILGNAEFARIEIGLGNPAADALNDVISAARRASDLCQQLLGISGKRRFSLGFVNLSLLCEEMLVILRTSIGRRVTVVRGRLDKRASARETSGHAGP